MIEIGDYFILNININWFLRNKSILITDDFLFFKGI